MFIFSVWFLLLWQIDKAATALKHSVEQFRAFIDGIDHWLANNRFKALNVFQTFDVNNTGRVSHDQLKAGTVFVCCITIQSATDQCRRLC